MSLLNDALRKKSRAFDKTRKMKLFQNQPKSHRPDKTRMYAIVILLFLVGAVTISAIWYVSSRSSFSTDEQLSVKKLDAEQEFTINKPARPQRPLQAPIKKEFKAETVVAKKMEQKAEKKERVTPKQKEKPKKSHKKATKPSKKPAKPSKTKASKTEKKKEAQAGALFYQKALSYHRRNMPDHAIRMYLEVLRANPEHYDAVFNLASVYMKTDAYSNAYPLLIELHDRDPENPKVLLNLAIAEIGLGNPNKAISHLSRAENKKNASQFEICLYHGVALSRLDKLDEAISWYKKAEKLHANHGLLIFNIAVAYDRLQEYRDALTYYEKFLRQPASSPSHEKKEVEARIRALRVYLAGQSENPIDNGNTRQEK